MVTTPYPSDYPPGTSVVLTTDCFAPEGETACLRLLNEGQTSPADLLLVAFTIPDTERLLRGIRSVQHPGRVQLVITSQERTEPALDAMRTRLSAPDQITLDTIGDPSELTDLGVAITGFLDQPAADTRPPVVCYRSLTTQLQYVELGQLRAFLNALTDALQEVGARSHFHLDPGAHDETTVRRLVDLFDARIDVE